MIPPLTGNQRKWGPDISETTSPRKEGHAVRLLWWSGSQKGYDNILYRNLHYGPDARDSPADGALELLFFPNPLSPSGAPKIAFIPDGIIPTRRR